MLFLLLRASSYRYLLQWIRKERYASIRSWGTPVEGKGRWSNCSLPEGPPKTIKSLKGVKELHYCKKLTNQNIAQNNTSIPE